MRIPWEPMNAILAGRGHVAGLGGMVRSVGRRGSDDRPDEEPPAGIAPEAAKADHAAPTPGNASHWRRRRRCETEGASDRAIS